ncbi:kinase-like protein [Lindgomyces ingoldianus]|uniref:Kinase-like protein n=1 Tax=Lindgomyces ingoldianus TaxID=673940 RepID=A0ACB6QTA6_9PLEO|nr:kinase-like protein [Lindgomyces ingoldianus]KAF2470254.1 kinase-like protein [Lindgomyces ingoldianus]
MEFLHSEKFFLSQYGTAEVLSKQGGAKVLLFGDELILKTGRRVSRAEEVAMRLVKEHTDVPVPEVGSSYYNANEGRLCMSFIPGKPLNKSWDYLDNTVKERLCHNIWSIIEKLRQIPKPPELQHLFLGLADGSNSRDVLVAELSEHQRLLDDEAVRSRIYERYYECNGRKYEKELPDMLPRAEFSVFTHGDISPRNIMFDSKTQQITGIIDWENAGWYPDYWEYANILKPSVDDNWQEWMDLTAPRKWDISGIMAARVVLL